MYEYSAKVVRVVDADTLILDVDLGFEVRKKMRVRLAEVNAPELNTDAGKTATEWVSSWLAENQRSDGSIIIRTVKDRQDRYGRYLAWVYGPTDYRSLSVDMIAMGWGLP